MEGTVLSCVSPGQVARNSGRHGQWSPCRPHPSPTRHAPPARRTRTLATRLRCRTHRGLSGVAVWGRSSTGVAPWPPRAPLSGHDRRYLARAGVL